MNEQEMLTRLDALQKDLAKIQFEATFSTQPPRLADRMGKACGELEDVREALRTKLAKDLTPST